jgi:RNA polymerase sigma-70 factor (ECF subfamily)
VGEDPDGPVIRSSLAEPSRFEVIFERHYETVRRYAQRRAGAAAGEEIAAQTFLVAFDRRASFRPEAVSARPWLLGIATNLVRHHVRDEATHLRILSGMAPPPAPGGPDDTDRLDALWLAPVIGRALEELTPDDRDTFLLFALGDLSYFEIAEALAIPTGTVRSRIHRVRRHLRERLGGSVERQADGTER